MTRVFLTRRAERQMAGATWTAAHRRWVEGLARDILLR